MKLKYYILITLLTVTFMIIGCNETASIEDDSAEVKTAISEPLDSTELTQVELSLKKMTIDEKIGQMMMIGIYGYEIDENISWMLNQYHCGGIILFDRNMDSKTQVKNLITDLQTKSVGKNPLFIAIDEEGGIVARMKHEIKAAPSQEEIGNTGEPDSAKIWAEMTVKELKSLGINVNFAPVADVGSPDTRSFSSDSSTVATFLDSAARGYETEDFIYCLKHFPGIGKRTSDPHQEISSIDVSRETLEKEDIYPFKFIIDRHPQDKFMIMVSHLKYPALDEENSATLSYKIMTNLLRKELNFNGIIITDDLEMSAVSNYNTFTDVGVKAVKAGADILLVCHDYQHEQEVYLGILKAVQNGEITEERINESVRRILKVKLNNFNLTFDKCEGKNL